MTASKPDVSVLQILHEWNDAEMRPTRLTGVDYNAIQLFERVAANGSIAGAAREIGITPSNATRRLIALEDALETRLFNRSTRQLKLTDAGRKALVWANEALVNLDTMADDLAAATGSPSGRVQLAVPHFGMNSYLPEVIASFARKYPEVILDLTTTDDMVNLIEDGFDIVIRYGTLPDSRAVAVRITEFERILCASPAYLEREGRPEQLQDLMLHHCIVHRQTDPATWAFKLGDQLFHQSVRAKVEVDNAFCLSSLCRQGLGLARLARSAVESEIADGTLVQLLEQYSCVEPSGDIPSLWVVHIGRDLPYRVRLLVDHLKREIPQVRRRMYEPG